MTSPPPDSRPICGLPSRPSAQSGERRIDAVIDAIAPGLRKTAPRERRPASAQHEQFLVAYRALIRRGWTVRAMARHLGISHRYLIDLRENARPVRTASCDWALKLWDLLGPVETADLPSGTDG